MHETEATLVDHDYSGRGVHEAARVAELAGADEIVASASTVVSAGWDQISPSEIIHLRGLPDPMEIVHIVWA